MPNGTSGGVGGSEVQTRSLPDVRPAAHVCLCGESPLTSREGEGLATRQSQGGNKLMKEADSKQPVRRTGSGCEASQLGERAKSR